MIVRYQPRFHYGAPAGPRERAYVRAAWHHRPVKAIARRLGVHRDRVQAIAAYLGLPRPVPLPHLAESPVISVPVVSRRRCQACEALMVTRRCRCGWEAVV